MIKQNVSNFEYYLLKYFLKIKKIIVKNGTCSAKLLRSSQQIKHSIVEIAERLRMRMSK